LVTAVISTVFLFGSFTLCTWLKEKYGWQIEVGTIRGIGGLLSIPIQGIGIYIAMQDVKKQTGMLSYGQAIKTGLTVAVTIAVVLAVSSLLYCILDPGYAAYMVKDAQKVMIANGEPAQQIKEHSAQVAQEFSPGMQVMQALVGQFFTGAIMSLIIGIFAKKSRAISIFIAKNEIKLPRY